MFSGLNRVHPLVIVSKITLPISTKGSAICRVWSPVLAAPTGTRNHGNEGGTSILWASAAHVPAPRSWRRRAGAVFSGLRQMLQMWENPPQQANIWSSTHLFPSSSGKQQQEVNRPPFLAFYTKGRARNVPDFNFCIFLYHLDFFFLLFYHQCGSTRTIGTLMCDAAGFVFRFLCTLVNLHTHSVKKHTNWETWKRGCSPSQPQRCCSGFLSEDESGSSSVPDGSSQAPVLAASACSYACRASSM